LVLSMLSAGIMLLAADLVPGQTFPNKPIRIVTGEAGGGADFVGRLVAQALSASVGQQVLVDNRGGSLIIPVQTVSKSSPDGYTLLLYSNGMWTLPFMQNVPYDAARDFSPVSLATAQPNILVVHPSVPAKSVKELVALARAKPGELNYARGPAGIPIHLAAELLKSMAGINIVPVPYKGSAAALSAAVAGEVNLMFPTATQMIAYRQSDKLRALAVTSAQPSALAPGLPTIASTGFPGYEVMSLFFFLAPAGTPAAVINRLNQELVQVLSRADIRERLFNAGIEALPSTPAQVTAAMKSETATMGKLIKDIGIRAD
jgi:tripartite-type tricarboxylate transporter receptor subunit TctC